MNKTEYRADIDGLRAIAVAQVLGYHAFPKAVPGGFIGVDVFFVVSGFLITSIVLTSEFSVVGFYARRARRLFPVLILVTAVTIVAGWLYLTPVQFEELGKQAAATALFVPNLLFWSEAGYFDPIALTKPLLHTWSLGIEEQFYLMWPAILLISGRFKYRAIWVILLTTALSAIYCSHLRYTGAGSAAFYSPFSRAWELSAGGLLSLTTSKHSSKLSTILATVGIGVIILVSLGLKGDNAWPNQKAVLIVFSSMLVIHFGKSSESAQRLLGSTPIAFMGKISYPLYLWHWPILTFLYLRNGSPPSTSQVAAAILASFCLASLSYLTLEKPLKKQVALRSVALATTAVLIAVGIAGLAISLENGIPGRLPNALQSALAYERYDFKTDAYNQGCWLGDTEAMSELPSVCLKAGRSDGVVVWGDSHAARLSPGLRQRFGSDRISQITRNGCVPVVDLGPPAALACRDGNADALGLIQRLHPEMVILFSAWQNYPTNWSVESEYGSKLAATIDRLKTAGKPNILVIGPAPKFDPSLPSMLLRDWSLAHWSSVPARLQIDRGVTEVIDHNLRRLSEIEEVHFFSLLNLLCNDQGCLTKLPNSTSRLLTWDYGHFTTDGAIIVAKALASRINGPSPIKGD